MDKITTVGLDLAKSALSLHGVDGQGRTVLRKTVRRDKLMELIAALPPCLIGMEACGGAHEWARQFQGHGHRIGRWCPCRNAAPKRTDTQSPQRLNRQACAWLATPRTNREAQHLRDALDLDR